MCPCDDTDPWTADEFTVNWGACEWTIEPVMDFSAACAWGFSGPVSPTGCGAFSGKVLHSVLLGVDNEKMILLINMRDDTNEVYPQIFYELPYAEGVCAGPNTLELASIDWQGATPDPALTYPGTITVRLV